MSTKTLADVVEALIGTAFLEGGFVKAKAVLSIFIPEVAWQKDSCASLLEATISSSLRDDQGQYGYLERLELLLGHTFTHKSLLVEAITHPSYISIRGGSSSYQRLEFLGDAILDYLVVTRIYAHAQPLSVPRMHLLRTAAVNASFLGFRSLSTTISIPATEIHVVPQTQQHSKITTTFSTKESNLTLLSFLRSAPSFSLSTALTATQSRLSALGNALQHGLGPKGTYPWRALAAFAPEKVVSDMVEAVLGAVFVDTAGDFGACELVARKLGILDWVEGVLDGKVVVDKHPKELIGEVAAGKAVKYEVSRAGVPMPGSGGNGGQEGGEWADDAGAGDETHVLGQGKFACRIWIGKEMVCEARGWNRLEVETAAAEEAIKISRARLEGGAGHAAEMVHGAGRKRRWEGDDHGVEDQMMD